MKRKNQIMKHGHVSAGGAASRIEADPARRFEVEG
jgi:hypothetical protein